MTTSKNLLYYNVIHQSTNLRLFDCSTFFMTIKKKTAPNEDPSLSKKSLGFPC